MNKSVLDSMFLAVLALGLAGCYSSPLPRDPIATRYVPQKRTLDPSKMLVISDAEYDKMVQAFAASLKNEKVFQDNYNGLKSKLPDGKLPVVVFKEVYPNLRDYKPDMNALQSLRFELATRFRKMGLFDVKELSSFGGMDIQSQIVSFMEASVNGSLDKNELTSWFGSHRGPEYFFLPELLLEHDKGLNTDIIKLQAKLYCLSPLSDRAGLLDWSDSYKLR